MEDGDGIPKGFAWKSPTILESLGEKRSGDGLEEKDEFGCKRVKVRDLDSCLAVSDEAPAHKSQFVVRNRIIHQSNLRGEGMSGVTRMPVVSNLGGSEGVWRENDGLPLDWEPSTTRKVPETGTSMANANSISTDDDRCAGNEMKQNGLLSSHLKGKRTADHALCCLRQMSEARTPGGAVEESDSLQGWKEMIQNGLLPCPLSGKASPPWYANRILRQLRQLSLSRSSAEESDLLQGSKETKQNSSADPSEEHISLNDNNHDLWREISSDPNAEALPRSANHVLCCLRPMSEDGTAEEPNSLASRKEMKQNDLLSDPLSGKAAPFEFSSSADPLSESDSMRRWKEMKRNGFLSGPLGGVATSSSTVSSPQGEMPGQKQQKSKRKGDFLKKKKELPKREQVDRFSNVAAPCGLLKELNPGIINHVRNRKQVRAVIEGLVRIAAEDADQRENQVGISGMGIDFSHLSHEDASLADANKTLKHSVSVGNSSTITSEDKSGLSLAESVGEDRVVPFKLSSNKASENACSITNLESANCISAAALTFEAATVASQWLELLHRDFNRRLSALQLSRKRVEGVVTTELPLLVSKEFPSNRYNNPHVINASGDGFSNYSTVEWHQSRWTLLFDEIHKALADEERELEFRLLQVEEMMSYCGQGLRHMDLASSFSSQSLGVSETDSSTLQNA